MSKRQNHYLSLIFALFCTIVDYYHSHVASNILITIEATIIVFFIYYLIGRGVLMVDDKLSKLFKRNN
jgi:hypothetical protein